MSNCTEYVPFKFRQLILCSPSNPARGVKIRESFFATQFVILPEILTRDSERLVLGLYALENKSCFLGYFGTSVLFLFLSARHILCQPVSNLHANFHVEIRITEL